MCGQVRNIHTLLTGLEVECCGYFSQDEGSECMNTLAHEVWRREEPTLKADKLRLNQLAVSRSCDD